MQMFFILDNEEAYRIILNNTVVKMFAFEQWNKSSQCQQCAKYDKIG